MTFPTKSYSRVGTFTSKPLHLNLFGDHGGKNHTR